jgi:hypothetical protein
MIEITINSFIELHEKLSKLKDGHVYRGVSKSEYKLIPSLGRKRVIGHSIERIEKDLLWVFKTQSLPYLESVPTTDIEWLTVAQHHGLPTRLLDWTRNPLAAAYFAVENHVEFDSAIYSYIPSGFFSEDDIHDLKLIKEVSLVLPSHRTKRIAAQLGLFTLHPNPEDSFEPDNLTKIIIPSECNQKIRFGLDNYGVNRSTLFPDMDGLSIHLRWRKGYL